MRTTHIAVAAAMAAALGMTGAHAQSIYGQVGTTGLVLGYAQHFDGFNLRADLNFMDYNRNITAGTVKYDAKLKFSSVGLFADYFVAGQFRVTGGLFLGRDKIDALGTPRPGSAVPEGEWVRGNIHSRNLRPYIGLGWGLGPQAGTGLSFAVDVGASYGRHSTAISASPNIENGAVLLWGPERLQQELAHLDDKVSKYKWFPVVRVGLTYRF